MRAAPAVDAALGSGRVERMMIIMLHAGCGAALAAWALAHAGGLAVTAAPLLSWLLAAAATLLMALVGAVLARRALPAGPARLRWDGLAWQLLSNEPPVAAPLRRVVVALDLGGWLLLHLHPAGGAAAVWRMASAGSVGAAWHSLRVALQAHAGEPAAAAPNGDPSP